MLVVDVDFNGFKRFLQNDAAFFWTETKNTIVLIKPRGEMVIRTIVTKTNPEADEAFKVREIYKHTAKYCLNFVIDGQPVEHLGIASKETEGQIYNDVEKKIIEEENENNATE